MLSQMFIVLITTALLARKYCGMSVSRKSDLHTNRYAEILIVHCFNIQPFWSSSELKQIWLCLECSVTLPWRDGFLQYVNSPVVFLSGLVVKWLLIWNQRVDENLWLIFNFSPLLWDPGKVSSEIAGFK